MPRRVPNPPPHDATQTDLRRAMYRRAHTAVSNTSLTVCIRLNVPATRKVCSLTTIFPIVGAIETVRVSLVGHIVDIQRIAADVNGLRRPASNPVLLPQIANAMGAFFQLLTPTSTILSRTGLPYLTYPRFGLSGVKPALRFYSLAIVTSAVFGALSQLFSSHPVGRFVFD